MNIEIKPKLKRSSKIKPLASAILEQAVECGAMLEELVAACDIAVRMVRLERSASLADDSAFMSRARVTLEEL